MGRDVAIKVLPDEFAQDEERLRRFQREAKVLASLNHPNIASIYGLERSGDTHYLVLELVPGETLAERISRGPIPVEEALEIATKIVEALAEAHEQGIVHRDLKPANIKITPDDEVMILDFGLAKSFDDDAPDANSSMSPTLTRDATRVGVIVGTAAYMSPEQAKGKKVDKRTDIFAFGSVLFEMLSGTRAFSGEDVTEVLASVIKLEPDWPALPGNLPVPVHQLLRRCLKKSARERLRDIGGALFALEANSPSERGALTAPSSRFPWLVSIGVVAVAAVATLLALSGLDTPRSTPTHLSIPLPADHPLVLGSTSSVAISRDGARVAFVARLGASTQLFVRDLGANAVEPVAGTEGGESAVFSPDGTSLVYFHRPSDQLRKVALDRGPPATLYEGGSYLGMSWDGEESVVVGRATDFGIWRVSVTGDAIKRLTTLDGDFWHYWPDVLPDGEAILFTANRGAGEGRDTDVLESVSGERRPVMRNATTAKYVPTGHLVFARQGTLFAVPFDRHTRTVSGEAVPVVEGLAVHQFGGAHYSFSDNGTLAYAPAPEARIEDDAIVLVDRDGSRQVLLEGELYTDPRISPDGRYLALEEGDYASRDVWLWDLEREVMSRFTFHDGGDGIPIWSPDSTRIVFVSNRAGGAYNLFWKQVQADAPMAALSPSENWQFANDWSPDGTLITYVQRHPTSRNDIWLYSTKDGEARPWLTTEFNEAAATFSPDSRWIAYSSNESGQSEVFVRPVDAGGVRPVQVSTDGGFEPMWSPAGGEIFYRRGNQMLAVPVSTSPSVTVGTPEVLFEGRFRRNANLDRVLGYDVTPDGTQFIMSRDVEVEPVYNLHVVLNWFEELERLVPAN